ncbi:MAG: bifunctional phosphoglucose/phosphomannose isomerase [Bacteroidia bacterium]|nr:bifunctional phosphoglucose/phosphomannose isomerase [Bacteroidia bacterium]
MKNLVEGFTKQLQEALDIAHKAILTKKNNIQNIVVTGLGGSGIGGTLLSELVQSECPIPIIVNKDYFLPEFVNSNSLVIISSYSGNTEETLSAMKQAIDKNAQIVCVTSGGEVHSIAQQYKFDTIIIPGGHPPRSCIGYSLIQLFKIVQFNGFVKTDLLNQVQTSITLLDNEKEAIKIESTIIAKKLLNKIPVIYSLGSCEGAAVRFRQQINENSKMLCWHHTLPEMNHNELVGWTEKNDSLAVVTFKTSFDYARTIKRYDICKTLFEKYSHSVTDITAKGTSKVEQFFYLINIGDWISCYIADLKNIDAVEVNVITNLKNELAKLN